jgi:hypothetical protein
VAAREAVTAGVMGMPPSARASSVAPATGGSGARRGSAPGSVRGSCSHWAAATGESLSARMEPDGTTGMGEPVPCSPACLAASSA